MALAKPAEPGDINATLNYTIDALKAKKYRKIYHHLLLPHFKQQIAKNGGIEKWLKEFAEIQGPKLLEMLVYIRKRNPYINNNNVYNGTATFVYDKPNEKFGVVRFKLDKGNWHLLPN